MQHELKWVGLYLVGLAFLLLFRRLIGTFWSVLGFLVLSLVYLNVGFDPAMPASLVKMFGAVTVLGCLLYVTSSKEMSDSFFGPIVGLMRSNGLVQLGLVLLGVLGIAGFLGYRTYAGARPTGDAPPKIRSIHPSPPNTIELQAAGSDEGRTIDVIRDPNPYRELEHTDPEAFAAVVARGKTVYYENCFFCHGDTMDGDGHFAHGINPVPAKFQAPDTIPMLTETFLFWRVAKGGPGLPDEGTPYDSTMPVWERFLSEEDMWASIMFLYDYTGYEPRADGGAH
ncbi:MAG: cytochrome c [Acidobacteriota bacterium]